MKKYLLHIVLTFIIITFVFSGCGNAATVPTVSPNETASAAQTVTPTAEFDNADVTLNGCNNKGLAFTADGILYVKEENFNENKACDMCILHSYNIESGEPMQSVVFEDQLDISEEYTISTKFHIICVNDGVFYLIREVSKETKTSDGLIFTYTIERKNADGSNDVLYELPAETSPRVLGMGDASWKTGKYIFLSYSIVDSKNKDAAPNYMLFRIDMETGEVQEMMNGLRNFSMEACDGQYIYYYVQSAESEVRSDMYRMDLDCKNKELLVQAISENSLMFSEGRFYFIQTEYNEQERTTTLCSAGLDLQDIIEIAEIDVTDPQAGRLYPINIAGGYAYFTDNSGLYRMSLEGGKPQKISDYEDIRTIDIAAGLLFIKYRTSGMEHIVTMLPDGSDIVELFIRLC